MSAFRLSAKSLEDLKTIGRFTLKSWGREQRNIYLSKLDESFHSLADQPYIEIIRILHDRMDVETRLSSG